MVYEHLRVQVEGPVGWLEFHRPPRNVFVPEMIAEVQAALAALGAERQVRVIVLASALPQHFSVGADLALFASLGSRGIGQWIAQVHDLVRALRRSAKPLLAAIHGMAVGGGLEMTFHCDVRFCAEDARLGLPEANVGFIPPMGSTLALPRLLGRHRAIRFLYDAVPVDAARALALGLVDELVPAGSLRAHVQAYGETLATRPPEALAAIRRAITEGDPQDFEAALRREYETALALARTDNFREGVKAFLEKRKPEWT